VILSAIVAFDFFECGQTKNKVLRGFFKVTYDITIFEHYDWNLKVGAREDNNNGN
jgi:hypothetical protein